MESRYVCLVLLAVLIAWPAAGSPARPLLACWGEGVGISPQHSSEERAGDSESSGQRGPQQSRLWLAGAEEAIAHTEISADLGGCSALITVTGPDAKPVFNAKVSTRIRYGLFAAKKLDLEVYTSASGQVKIVGVPESPKRPIIFQISKGQRQETLEFKPESNCHADFNVRLK